MTVVDVYESADNSHLPQKETEKKKKKKEEGKWKRKKKKKQRIENQTANLFALFLMIEKPVWFFWFFFLLTVLCVLYHQHCHKDVDHHDMFFPTGGRDKNKNWKIGILF